jgi:cell wall-associated NlpC family hydrolase
MTGPAARAAAGLTLAGAATAGALHGAATAEPRHTAAEVRERVDTLHHEAEEATERYNGATEAADGAERQLEQLRERAARRTASLNTARNAVGAHATAEYRSGGLSPTVQLALASRPDDFLSRAAVLDRAADRQSGAVQRMRRQLDELARLRGEAAAETEVLRAAQRRAARERGAVQRKLAEAEKLLKTITAEERARLLAAEGHGATEGHGTGQDDGRNGTGRTAGPARADRGAPAPVAPQPVAGRASRALAFAHAQLGKPYGWGATGPAAYDCSGLTQAAWAAAGVQLPRTSYSQVNAGTRVSRSELAPGDLVFYYSGLSHVALYIGDGQIIHAARPGTPVRLAPVDSMPFAAATRPG